MSLTTTRHVAQRLWSRQLELPLHEARDADDVNHKYDHRGRRVDFVLRLVVGLLAAAIVFSIGFSLFVFVFEHATVRLHNRAHHSTASRPVPAIIQRFRLIKRASAPARGVDRDSVRLAFPHWQRTADAPIDLDYALEDLALAISIMSDRLFEISQNDLEVLALADKK